MSEGATYRLNDYMSSNRFKVILGFLHYIDKRDVEYYDGFLHMRQMEEAWYLNMTEAFL